MSILLELIILTFLPFLELRASIPYGIFASNIHWFWIFVICCLTNIILSFFVYAFVNYVMKLFLKVKFINKIYEKIVERSQRKVKPYVDKYGTIGLAIFIGIPLPGSGVYTGGLGAYLLGFKFKDYIIASIIGVLIAGTIVTLVSVTGSEALYFMLKVI
ncbi:small multi-drug export protein [archaeon]|jgi:uncharacterized membrane protein|nr:small multi-drug export protein [archaeon]MBT3451226.1 small multi-drug export protein [archaeon]MBT6868677.1 small multi-drug export protein [archaeon]MBT7193465.1 small multi-drug export protein [archaeon]MBT7381056.1 small multi-drug export protein [archaeon]